MYFAHQSDRLNFKFKCQLTAPWFTRHDLHQLVECGDKQTDNNQPSFPIQIGPSKHESILSY